jgi:GWxTD domain-containing protein
VLYRVLLILIIGGFYQPIKGQKNTFNVYFNTVQFYTPEVGNYLELYFQFDAKHCKFLETGQGLQATVYMNLEIKDSTGKVHFKDEYLLNSPLYSDSIVEDFYEIRRVPLPSGLFQINMVINDQNTKLPDLRGSDLLEVLDFSKGPMLSEIEPIDYAKADSVESTFMKNGYFMIPKIHNYYGNSSFNLPVYFEVYNVNTYDTYRIEQQVLNTETQTEVPGYRFENSIHGDEVVVPMLRNIDISGLPSGSYALNTVLKNEKDSVLHVVNYLFDRGNFAVDDTIDEQNIVLNPEFQKSLGDDSLYFFLESLLPMAKASENKNILRLLKSKDVVALRKYFQAFWNLTAPGDAYNAWTKYKAQVWYVDRLFRTNFQAGHATDRGRVYLQYGAPSTVNAREGSPSEYPYEVWFYNKIGKFSNRRFVFYNPDLTNNAYRLLHSDLIGEVKNPGWSQILSKRNTINGTVDDPNLFNDRHWGQNSNDLFRQY